MGKETVSERMDRLRRTSALQEAFSDGPLHEGGEVKGYDIGQFTVRIVGDRPLIPHRWSIK